MAILLDMASEIVDLRTNLIRNNIFDWTQIYTIFTGNSDA